MVRWGGSGAKRGPVSSAPLAAVFDHYWFPGAEPGCEHADVNGEEDPAAQILRERWIELVRWDAQREVRNDGDGEGARRDDGGHEADGWRSHETTACEKLAP